MHQGAILHGQPCADSKGEQTVFTKDEIQGAEEARHIQQLIGWPSTTTFKNIVAKNMLCNYPITVEILREPRPFLASLNLSAKIR